MSQVFDLMAQFEYATSPDTQRWPWRWRARMRRCCEGKSTSASSCDPQDSPSPAYFPRGCPSWHWWLCFKAQHYFTLVHVCCSLCFVFLMRLRLNHRGLFYFSENTWHVIKSIKTVFLIFNLQPTFPQMVFQLFKSTHTAFCRACMSVMVTVQLFHLNPWAIRSCWNMRNHAEFGKMRFFIPKSCAR